MQVHAQLCGLESAQALRQKRQVDVCIANVENASGGSGLTPENGRQLLAAGVDVMTMGADCGSLSWPE